MYLKKINKLLMVLIASVLVSYADTLPLNGGWNLIGTDSNTSLESIKSSVGADNLLVIQGPSKTYQKRYVDNGTSFLNDFTHFEKGKGYWIKLVHSATLYFTKMQFSPKEVISLKSGWNLIDPLSDLNLTTILDQLGLSNILVIQGPSKTYQKRYVDNETSFLNDFTHFEDGKGYWIKLIHDANLTFTFNTSLSYPPQVPDINDTSDNGNLSFPPSVPSPE